MAQGGKGTALALTAAQRRSQAVILRRSGLTFQEIGDQLGISKQAAHGAVTKALRAIRDAIVQDAELLVAEEVGRLNKLQSAWWTKAISGDRDAAAIVLKCINDRAKLLGIGGGVPLPPPDLSGGAQPHRAGGADPDGAAQDAAEAYREAMAILDAARARTIDGGDTADITDAEFRQ